MEVNIDNLINFFSNFSESKGEIGEQETGAEGTTTSAKSPKKWESGRVFGKSYMNDPKSVWTSNRTFGKTYMNDPKYVWKSDRQMGKTSGSDYA